MHLLSRSDKFNNIKTYMIIKETWKPAFNKGEIMVRYLLKIFSSYKGENPMGLLEMFPTEFTF